ncbi:DUF262 domain-containing protein [Bacteroides helcogenes]|uniref:DUF262 domain-containing protein n=1 Tax=Bacteroides helcogenes (strain ATCC 35417 / DSM 20613 / JCM 6297 / CCUG 15421 / P 36-108) TaxID=693979 RepID=E6SWU1_BACT6|nr:DUF262 domain-containing protein [Bacteroides helcogenes]ADV43643.1 protein of unknown function DUF262 [Bacteroides helcogenes P 36-108]MDY5239364.1 DUF262 domain-containing protein [Bacteroides helcogenes]
MDIDMVKELRILDETTIFDTNVRYVIPRYQRAYAWEDKEIEQLIDDIYDINQSENYYIGSLVVSKIKDKSETYEVVDGQQRLTTLYLLLQYLFSEQVLDGEVGQTLSFDCRANSNYTLSNIQKVLNGDVYSDDEERVEQSILNGIKVIRQKFNNNQIIDKRKFVSRLKQVILYQIEVPENTDLNRYFEIMNTRGEQLEQHDILKAQLMRHLNDRNEQEFFSRVWNACSDMTGYVQMHFAPQERLNIFGSEWNYYPADNWNEYNDSFYITEDSENDVTINEIIKHEFQVNDVDGTDDNDKHIRFDSIIDFPYFLLHSLRVFVERYNVSLKKNFGELLDDKKLIADFGKVIKHGTMDNKAIMDNKEEFSQMFIIHLLQSRFIFDQFIIKREYTGEDKDGVWSLKELHTSGQSSKKKAYYINTKLNYDKEWEKTYAPRNKECLMIQSALRVSYTSPKVMHWITDLLLWLFKNDETPELITEAEKVAVQATKENFLDKGDYKLGIKTPHIVFNFLDYLLWKDDKKKYADFEFEFRNSVEHWYPQHPSDGTFDPWDDKDTFGNLCIISRSVNSKFSNLSPESKMKSYGRMVKKGSLKLRMMGDIIQNYSNDDWVKTKCQEHESQMIELLETACIC